MGASVAGGFHLMLVPRLDLPGILKAGKRACPDKVGNS